MSRIALVICLIFFISNHLQVYGNELPTNKQIVDSIFDAFLSKNVIKLKEGKITQIRVADNSEFTYFNNKLINALINNNIKIDNNSNITIKINFDEYKIQYIESKNELTRSIDIIATLYLIDINGDTNLLDKLNTSFRDTIDPEHIPAIENAMFPFTKGNIPKPKKSIFDEIIEPVIVVSAAVITVILFFSVRTK